MSNFLNKTRLVGAYLPQPLMDKLGILILLEGTSRSALLKDLIKERLKGDDTDMTTMLDRIAEKIALEWRDTPVGERLPYDKFIDQLCGALERKRIAKYHINEIISKVREYDATN